MRYFLVSGKVIMNDVIHFQDSLTISSEKFPSHKFIKSKMIENFERLSGDKAEKTSGIFVVNVFEFNDEKDCNDYNDIETTPIEKEMD
jgi:hypothetical protein